MSRSSSVPVADVRVGWSPDRCQFEQMNVTAGVKAEALRPICEEIVDAN